MSHYAKIENNKVVSVIVADDKIIDKLDGEYIKTSYNTKANSHPYKNPIRGNYAGIGYEYNREFDVFIPPKPYDSWVLNANYVWEAPIQMPDDGAYEWNEATTSWDKILNGVEI
jgi:hypothetical protein